MAKRKSRPKINDLEDLRDHMIGVLSDLSSGEIDVEDAGVSAKLCEGVISSLKVQMEYARALGKEPQIPFVGKCTGKTIEIKRPRLLSGATDSGVLR